jgi:hypothetical protein
MVCIAASPAAFEAVAATSPLVRVVYEIERNAKGERLIWVERLALDKLDAQRALSKSYSDVILRLVAPDA